METPIGPPDPGHQEVLDDLVLWVQRALRQYAEDPACGECLRLAREGLAQLQVGIAVAARGEGTGLTGTGVGAGVAEELLRVVTALEQGALSASPEGAAILLRAVLCLSDPRGPLDQLPSNELPEDWLRLGQRMVNELRGLRGAVPLMLAALVPPESAGPAVVLPAAPTSGPPDAPVTVAGAATGPIPALQAARRRFREALLEWLQDRVGTFGSRAMAEVAAEIVDLLPESHSAGPDCRRLFIVVDGLMQDLASGSVSPSLANKRLLGRVDRQLSQCLQRIEAVGLTAEAVLVEPGLIASLLEARALLAPAADPNAWDQNAWDPDVADPDAAPAAPGPPADAQEAEHLARVRREGGATMARLAAAFAALEHTPLAAATEGPVPDVPEPSAPESTGPEPRSQAADPAGIEARRQVAELALWHPRAVEALTRAAAQAQALEERISRADSGGHSVVALEELQQLLAAAIGDASAALLQQQRAIRALQESLTPDPPVDAPNLRGD